MMEETQDFEAEVEKCKVIAAGVVGHLAEDHPDGNAGQFILALLITLAAGIVATKGGLSGLKGGTFMCKEALGVLVDMMERDGNTADVNFPH